MPRYIKKKSSLKHSFSYAFTGIAHAFATQRNLKIHIVAFCSIFILGLYFKINSLEWAILLLTSGLVITLEMINTALELVVDLSTKEKKIRAKLSKDTAAGAVLIASTIAVVCGTLIFYERLVTLIKGGI